MIKAALIDLDGTILDSMGMWETLGVDILESLGFTSEEDINELFKSFTVRQAAEYYHDHFPTQKTVLELEEIINKTIEDAYTDKLPLKDGAENFLNDLKKNGLTLALVTTTNSFLAKKALERLGVLNNFSLVLSCDDLNCSKKEPTIYDKACEELNVDKAEVLIFEDALHAIKTAKDNGYTTVGIYDRFVPEQEEIKNLADYYIKSLNDSEFLTNLIIEEKYEESLNNSR